MHIQYITYFMGIILVGVIWHCRLACSGAIQLESPPLWAYFTLLLTIVQYTTVEIKYYLKLTKFE